ncbi:MAG: RnfABCDGE type electron transport complex subunit G [Lachnospiraceae bacterium]|jgi:electron transport complex protein RnfG|nr:RnfABCDGE type electron transport complex subunit G [Lachnospiraceae bacterium]
MNKKIVHDALVLTAFTLVLGLMLGVVYDITKEPIAAAEKAALDEAYKVVFADAAEFQEEESFQAEEAAAVIAASEFPNDEITAVNKALDSSGNVLGYVINVTSHEGSQADISFSVGIQSDGTLNGYSITAISETPGLGVLVQEEPFYSQFQGKAEEVYAVVKSAPAAENEIQAVTGATISSRAITNGVNACLVYFRAVLQGGN